mmetsp:Transcript_1162/g.2849  ORF Transcript_1162/g.2849 Transcript_1162/m.2849 type:complete len:248 (+) Transcript_1162:597-1340(+)
MLQYSSRRRLLPPMAMPNRPNMPWECAGCGNYNGFRKLRCGTCSSWKNGKKQLSQRTKAVAVARSVHPSHRDEYHHNWRRRRQQQQEGPPKEGPSLDDAVDGVLFAPHWDCHRCEAQVSGAKERCPTCKSWKGGMRLNFKRGDSKPVQKNWTCHGCNKENNGNRVQCHSCQSWRDGRRPDMLLRRLEDQGLSGSWACERCRKENKATKTRCGGCQGWRGGQRPDMKKKASAQQHTPSITNASRQQQY